MKYNSIKEDKFNLIFLMIIIGIVPLIVLGKVIPIDNMAIQHDMGQTDVDFYSYSKMFMFLILVTASLIVFIYNLYKKHIKFKESKVYIFSGIYVAVAVLSTIVAVDKNIAMKGLYGRYENILVLVAYICILIITINVINSEKEIKLITYALSFSVFIIGIIGLSQFLGHDFFTSNFGKTLMIFGNSDINPNTLTSTLEKYTVYGTLANSNYMGSFIVLVLPLMVLLLLIAKNLKQRIIFGLICLLNMVCIFGSRSRAGIIGIFVILIMFLILYRKEIIAKWKYFVPAVCILIIAVIIMNSVTGGTILRKYTSKTVDPRLSINKGQLEDVKIKSNSINIITKSESMKIVYENQKLDFLDDKGQPITNEFINGNINLNNNKYKNYKILISEIDNLPAIKVSIRDINMYFVLKNNEFKFVNPHKEFVDLKPIESFGFKDKEQLGSGRGFIWSRSIPLLKNTILVGFGPDNFALKFPQDDYIGKIKTYGTMRMPVDKPHNFYLQTALNTGVISLIAILGIFLIYIVQSFKLYFNNPQKNYYYKIGTSIFIGITGYLATCMFNDSVISVAPVFWILLGVGISINLKLSK